MMKRLLALIAALMMMCSLSAHAEEELYDKIENALYRLVLRTEEGDVPMGSGVLFVDPTILLTAESCAPYGELYAIGTDGEHAITGAQALGDSGVMLLEMETPSAHTPLNLAGESASGLACLFGVDSRGDEAISSLYQVRQSLYRGQDALLLSSTEGLLPGCFMTDDKGGLIGLVVAQQTEGVGSYIALDANVIYRAFTRMQYVDDFLPITMAWQEGNLIVAWEDEPRDSGLYLITVSGAENSYYTYFHAETSQSSIELQLPPGHSYYVQVQWAESPDAMLEPVLAAMDTFTVGEETFTAYQYQQECILVTRPGDNPSAKTEVLEVPTLTNLTDPAITRHLKVTSSYDVAETIELPMSVELIAPDGQFFYESAISTFTPDREKEDAFLLPMDDLLADCAQFSGLKEGRYLLRYSLNGQIAGEYEFTLDGAESAAVEIAPAVSGLATGLTVQYADGVITLGWDGASVPEGAAVDVFYLFEGNAYYTYHHLHEGETSTEICTVPGRQTMAWVVWSTEEGVEPPMPQTASDYVLIPGTEETPLMANNFTNVRLNVTVSKDPNADTSTEFLPAVPLTREVLTDREYSLYFQTEDTYQVTETSSEHPLVIALYTPEGLVFAAAASYIYDVTLQESDMWVMNISDLRADYESLICGAWPAGEYRVLYCIDGQIAGEYTFTLD